MNRPAETPKTLNPAGKARDGVVVVRRRNAARVNDAWWSARRDAT
jgi:hypothetical protein